MPVVCVAKECNRESDAECIVICRSALTTRRWRIQNPGEVVVSALMKLLGVVHGYRTHIQPERSSLESNARVVTEPSRDRLRACNKGSGTPNNVQ